MGRPKTFDDDEVLDKAVACFRQNGFDSTSIRDLEVFTGLKAASIYKAFGNKDSLYSHALARYRTEVLDRRTGTYLNPDRGIGGIIDFFTSTYQVEPSPGLGCLFTTSAIESSALDPTAKQHLESGLTAIRFALREHIVRCQANGEVAPSVDADAASTALLMLYEGLLVLLRSGSDTAAFTEALHKTIPSMLTTNLNTNQRKNR